jgi:hypothetical protein
LKIVIINKKYFIEIARKQPIVIPVLGFDKDKGLKREALELNI